MEDSVNVALNNHVMVNDVKRIWWVIQNLIFHSPHGMYSQSIIDRNIATPVLNTCHVFPYIVKLIDT